MENAPGRCIEPAFVFDFGGIAAAADMGKASQHVREVNGGGEFRTFRGILGAMVVACDFDEHFGEIMLTQINCAEFGMIDAEDALLAFEQVAVFERAVQIDCAEMFRESGGENNFTHVVNEAGDVIGFVFAADDWIGEFASEDSGSDAVLPKFTPGEQSITGEAVEIFNNGSDDGELADLTDTEIENRFLDAVHGRSQAVID